MNIRVASGQSFVRRSMRLRQQWRRRSTSRRESCCSVRAALRERLSFHVAVEGTGMCLEDIGRSLGITGWAASKLRQAAKRMYESDPEYRAQIDAIRARLKLNFQT